MRYRVISTGEIIKNLREYIKASQQDIAGDLTRQYISQVENNKSNLSPMTARIIAENINKIADEKGIKLENITSEYLLEENAVRVNKFADELIKKLKLYKMKASIDINFKELVSDIEGFLNENELDSNRTCEIYELISEIYINTLSWKEAKLYGLKCVELLLKNDNYGSILSLLANLSRVLLIVDKHDDIIVLSSYAFIIYEKYKLKDDDSFKRICFNAAIANNQLGNCEECLKLIKIIETEFALTENQSNELKILKASCYLSLNEYIKSENIFLDLLNAATTEEKINVVAISLLNLALIKAETGDYDKSRHFMDEAFGLKVSERYEGIISYETINIFIMLDELNKVKKQYPEALKILIKDKYDNKQHLLMVKLVKYFIDKGENNELNFIVSFIDNNIENGLVNNKAITEIYFLVGDYFMDIDFNTAKEIIKKGLNAINIIKK